MEPARRPVVAHVFGAMDRGGAELRTLAVARRVDDVAHLFLTLSGRAGDLAPSIADMGGRVLPVRLHSPMFPVRFVRALRRNGVTVLHSNVATFSGVLLLLGWFARVPVRVAHFRSDGDGHADTRARLLQRAVMRRLIRAFATDVWAVSPGAMSGGWGGDGWHADARCRVVPNGIEVASLVVPQPRSAEPGVTPGRPADEFPDLPSHQQGDCVVAHVGRSLSSKNRLRAVRIVRGLHDQDDDTHLALVGAMDDTEQTSIRAVVGGTAFSSALHVTGPIDDVPGLLRRCSVLLVTSTREGLPGVVLEALAVGTPVVSSDLPGAQWIASVVDGVTLLSLDEPDDAWIGALRRAASLDTRQRSAIAASFATSPFVLADAVRAFGLLWRGRSVDDEARTSDVSPVGAEIR